MFEFLSVLLDPFTQFLFTGWLTYIVVRFFADWYSLRLYVDFSTGHLEVGKPKPKGKSIHLHHFTWGMLLVPITSLALWYHTAFAPALIAVEMALIGSETKELLLSKWGK